MNEICIKRKLIKREYLIRLYLIVNLCLVEM